MTAPRTSFDLMTERLNPKPVPIARPGVELGTSGLSRTGGWITEEFLTDLRGQQGLKKYREMRDNSPVVGAILYAIEMMARETGWRVEAGTEDASGEAARLFVEECLEDMSAPFADTLGDILSCLPFGFSFHEIVYKRRQGPRPNAPGESSQFTDGKIGWRKWAIRGQLTLWRWVLDPTGGIQGFEQMDPSVQRGPVLIPIQKGLLFRPFAYLNNPEGRSILRTAYVPYYFCKRIQEIEAIGIERDLAGLPVVRIPNEVLADASKAEPWKKLVQDVKRNQQAGVVIPSDRDDKGNLYYELTLLSTGGERQVPTEQVITRYETRIMQTVLADFIQMGQAQVGTQALAQTKAGLFATAMGAFLDSIESVINRHAIPRLLAINGMPLEAPPEFHFDEIEYEDVGQWVEALSKLAGAGMPIFPDPLVENVVRGKLDLPELTEEEIEQRQQEDEAEKQDAKERERLMADAALAAAQNPQGAGKPQEA